MFVMSTGVQGLKLPRRIARRHRSRIKRSPRIRAQMPKTSQKLSMQEVKKLWRSAQAVCLDVDSTLIAEESIDELADFLGVGQQVADVTNKAMCGDMKFEDALRMRLNVMKPSKSDIMDYLIRSPPKLTKDIPELIQILQERRKAVYLISGGFRDIIDPIAEQLRIDKKHIYANTLLFNSDGSYAGFDRSEFTSRSGGKAAAVQAIRAENRFNSMVMIGDGATDLEARTEGAVELFIGYGGVVRRALIEEQADWFVTDIRTLLNELSSAKKN